MTKPRISKIKHSWSPAGDSTTREFPVIKEFDVPIPERQMEEFNSPGDSTTKEHYVHAIPKEVTVEMLQQTLVWLALACGNDDYDAANDVHEMVDTINGDNDFGDEGIKLVDIHVDDDNVHQFLAEDCAVKQWTGKATYEEEPKQEVIFRVPKVTMGDPGTDRQDFDDDNIIAMKDCHVYVDGNEVEAVEAEARVIPEVKEAGVIGMEQQETHIFSNWKVEVDIDGIEDSGVWELNDLYPTSGYYNIDVYFGGDAVPPADPAGPHWIHFDLNSFHQRTPEQTLAGNEFAMIKKTLVPGPESAMRISCRDATLGTGYFDLTGW